MGAKKDVGKRLTQKLCFATGNSEEEKAVPLFFSNYKVSVSI